MPRNATAASATASSTARADRAAATRAALARVLCSPAFLVFAAAAAVLASLAVRVRDWAVMTDELLYERLALAIAEPGLPQLHGELTNVSSLLYPILISPVLAIVAMPDAIAAVHAWNGVLFASASIPVYLLARDLGLPSVARWGAAAFAVATPWSVITAFVMTESAAYPAAMWAFYAAHRAAVRPSDRSHAFALAAIAAATLARPQLVVIAVALVATVSVVELRLRRGWRPHRVLLGAAIAAFAFVLLLAALGSLGSALGTYATTVEDGDILSLAAVKSAIVHIDVLGVAVFLVPLLLGAGWALEAVTRRQPALELHALAALVVAATVLVSVQVGSFTARFAADVGAKERYAFYLAPLLFVAAAAALRDPTPRVVGVLVVTVAFVTTVGWEDFVAAPGINVDSPGSAIHDPLSQVFGGDVAAWVAAIAGVVAVAIVVALRTRRTQLLAIALAAVGVGCALESGYAWDRLLGSRGPSARELTAAAPITLAWIDGAVRDGGEVGVLPYSIDEQWFVSAVKWWDVEYWNKTVDAAYMVGEEFTYTPRTFPLRQLQVDWETGAASGVATPYIVRSVRDARLALAGDRVAEFADLELVRVAAPRRAAWATRGIDPDGWTRAGRDATIRLFGDGALAVTVTLAAPQANAPVGYDLGGGRIGYLTPGEIRPIAFEVCPVSGRADATVRILGSTRIRGVTISPPYSDTFRRVGAQLARIDAAPTGRACAP